MKIVTIVLTTKLENEKITFILLKYEVQNLPKNNRKYKDIGNLYRKQ